MSTLFLVPQCDQVFTSSGNNLKSWSLAQLRRDALADGVVFRLDSATSSHSTIPLSPAHSLEPSGGSITSPPSSQPVHFLRAAAEQLGRVASAGEGLNRYGSGAVAGRSGSGSAVPPPLPPISTGGSMQGVGPNSVDGGRAAGSDKAPSAPPSSSTTVGGSGGGGGAGVSAAAAAAAHGLLAIPTRCTADNPMKAMQQQLIEQQRQESQRRREEQMAYSQMYNPQQQQQQQQQQQVGGCEEGCL